MLKRLVVSLQCGFDSFTKKLDSRNYRFISGSDLQSGLSWFCCFYCGCIICFEIIYYGEDSGALYASRYIEILYPGSVKLVIGILMRFRLICRLL